MTAPPGRGGPPGDAAKQRVMLVLLGRRGAMPRLALQIARAGLQRDEFDLTLALARDNDLIESFGFLGDRLLAVDVVDRGSVLRSAHNMLRCTRPILARIFAERPRAVINLCPHVATPLLARSICRLGIPYTTIVHDAAGHPGDRSAVFAPWFRLEARIADSVVTLSRHVAAELAGRRVAPARITPLFLPDLVYTPEAGPRRRETAKPLRLLFFGRLLKYRGLHLLVDALENLAQQGIGVRTTIAGAGSIAPRTARQLSALGCCIINRWVGEGELARLLARHDAVVAAHLECSQSGVVAAAYGSGLPVVALPVGGLAEQVQDSRTGVLADGVDAAALARAIHRLARDGDLYQSVSAHLAATRPLRSTERFLEELLAPHTAPSAAPDGCCQAAVT